MLEIRDLTVRYGARTAVEQLTLAAADREVVAVIGPSGCGKSTLLRAVAGLVVPVRGSIRIDGRVADGQRPDERGIGLMFQDHALFPHRTVGENVAFGPRMHGLSRGEIRERVRDALDLVGFAGSEHRRVTELSGGEQQRVALARAIAPRPRLLMLDEPLGSLDRALRDRLLDDLPRVFERLGTTVVYVTHDQHEALALSDRIAVMREGRLEQEGTPEQVWSAPATAFVARFVGLDHLEVVVVDGVAATDLGPVRVTGGDGPATLVLRADALRLLTVGDHRTRSTPSEITVDVTVTERRFAGDHLRIEVATASGRRFELRVRRGACVEPGTAATLALDTQAVHRLSRGDG